MKKLSVRERTVDELRSDFPYRVGDTIEMEVPTVIGWITSKFKVEKIFKRFVLLNNGAYRVCFQLSDFVEGNEVKGVWS